MFIDRNAMSLSTPFGGAEINETLASGVKPWRFASAITYRPKFLFFRQTREARL
jgi:hypothetical protein